MGRAGVRVGFSAEGSLFLGEDSTSICFDNEGGMVFNKKRSKGHASFGRDVMVGLLLNLDEKSENFNTISIFRDGRRVSQPQALPEELKGKTLFPAVSFRNATVHCNFGAPVVALPFTCRGVGEAAQKDATVTKYPEPADGKYEVLFPVSLPDEGSFDWLDAFLEKNPSFTELSDRSFTEWAIKSGVQATGSRQSNDKPGVTALQDLAGIKKTLMELAALQPRNFVIMEVKGNLIKDERAKALAKFKSPVYKTVADVILNQPSADFKKIVHTKTLAAKQNKADQEAKSKFLVEKREWQVRKKTKENDKAKKKQQKEFLKKQEEAKKVQDARLKKAKKDAAAKVAAAKGEEAPADEEEEEEKPEEKAESEEEAEEADEPEPTETPADKVSLTAEEKSARFFNHHVKDMVEKDLALSFTKFSLPEADEFSAVKYSWSKNTEAAAYMKTWILDRKNTIRVEDIVPSAWFKQKAAAWTGDTGRWKHKQNDYKTLVAKKHADKANKAKRRVLAEAKAKMWAEKEAKEAEEKAKKEEEAAAKAPEEKKEGEEETKKEEEVKVPPTEKKPFEPEVFSDDEIEVEFDFEGVDVFGAEDITDLGNKVPLFRDFGFEDHAMMTLRFELHLLAHAFSKDCTDTDRKGIPCDHLAFYYQRYYGKQLHFGSFGVTTAAELIALVSDCIVVNKSNVMESMIPGDLESNAVFAKITEAARRQRHLQLDMGEETARLKIKNTDGGNHNQGEKRSWGNDQKGGKGDQRQWNDHGKGGGNGADFQSTKVCNDFQRGQCNRGDACKFAHVAASGGGKADQKGWAQQQQMQQQQAQMMQQMAQKGGGGKFGGGKDFGKGGGKAG